MKNLFYINYNKLKYFTNKESEIGVILDVNELGLNTLHDFITKIMEDKIDFNIRRVLVKLDVEQDSITKLKIDDRDILYYSFNNEEEIRQYIETMPEDVKKRVIGKKICKSGVDILSYRAIGISNIFISSPIINDSSQLEMLKKIGYTLFCVPNYNRNFGSEIDPSWIRPEAVSLYDNINDWILECCQSMNINTIYNAYSKGAWLGSIKDFLVGFNESYNIYRNTRNMLIPTFDFKRVHCRADCLNCNKCIREFNLTKNITEKG